MAPLVIIYFLLFSEIITESLRRLKSNGISSISLKLFSEILNKFTVYPGEFEKKLIISKIAVDDKYIDYINLTE